MMPQTAAEVASEQQRSRTTVDGHSSFQYADRHRPDHEYFPFYQQPDTAPQKTSVEAIAPHNFDASVLTGFRQAHREHAATTA